MHSTLYDEDIVLWAEQQGAALRRLAETGGGSSNELDYENLAEEIEAVGRTETRAASAPARLILVHLLKAASVSEAAARAHWRTEVLTWRHDLIEALTPAMRQRIDMDALWRRARREADSKLREYGQALAVDLPLRSSLFTLDDLAAEAFDFDRAVALLSELSENKSAPS